MPKDEVREYLLPIIFFPGLMLSRKRVFLRAFDLYVEKNISFADAYNAALMEKLRITDVASYGPHFDRIKGIHRFEP